MKKLKFGVCIFPQTPLPEVIAQAQLAEELGYDSFWVADSQLLCRELYVTLAACALNTDRIKIGAGVTAPFTRHVSVTAGAFASLSELAPGRIMLGIGTGNSLVRTIGSRPSRIADLERYVERLTALLNNQITSFDSGVEGKISWLDNPTGIPIYVAATGPNMIKAATRMTSNIIIMVGSHPNLITPGIQSIAEGAKAAGRDTDKIDTILWVPFAISDKEHVARENVGKHVAGLLHRVNPAYFDESDADVIQRIRQGFAPYPHNSASLGDVSQIPAKFIDMLALSGTSTSIRSQIENMSSVSGFNTLVLNTQNSESKDGKFPTLEYSLKSFAEGVMSYSD